MGFLHEHKISLRNDFDTLMKQGNVCMSFPLQFKFIAKKSDSSRFSVAISVPKKRFHHAADRNRQKRCIREAIRLIYKEQDWQQFDVQILILFRSSELSDLNSVKPHVEQGLLKIKSYAENH